MRASTYSKADVYPDIKIATPFNLAGNAGLAIPNDRVVVAITAQDADFANLRYQVSYDGGTNWYALARDDGSVSILGGQAVFYPVPKIRSDGVIVRIFAFTTAIDDISYIYYEVE